MNWSHRMILSFIIIKYFTPLIRMRLNHFRWACKMKISIHLQMGVCRRKIHLVYLSFLTIFYLVCAARDRDTKPGGDN